jgi:hypothetical protein
MAAGIDFQDQTVTPAKAGVTVFNILEAKPNCLMKF